MARLARALCSGVVWVVVATEVLATVSGDPSHVDSLRELPQQGGSSGPGPHNSHEGDANSAGKPASAELLPASRVLQSNAKDAGAATAATAAPPVTAAPAAPAATGAATAETAATAAATVAAAAGDMPSELSTAKAEIARLEAALQKEAATKQKEVGDLAKQVAEQEKSIADSAAKESAAKSELQKKIDAMSAENKKLMDEAASLSSQIKTKTQDHAQAQNELSKTQGLLDGARKELETALEQLKKLPVLEKQIESLTAQHQGVSEELSRSKGAVAVLNEEVTTHLAARKEMLLTGRAQQKKLEDLQSDHSKLRHQHDLLRTQYADPSVQHFLSAKAIKVYSSPGIEGAANKTFIYVLPSLQRRYAKGQQFVNATQSAVYSKLNAYIGTEQVDPWLPAVSGMLVYGSIIVPFMCTVCCLTRIVCRLKAFLLFCHLDFLLTTLCAGGFALWTGKEPLAAFAHHDASLYLFTQVIFGLAYCLYCLLLFVAYCCSHGGTFEGAYRILQMLGAAPIGVIYYLYVWTPAMLDQMPRMTSLVEWIVGEGAAVSHYAWLPYLPVSFLFFVLLRLERLSWQQASSARSNKEQQMTMVMRDDLELATVVGQGYAPVPKSE